MNKTFKVLLSIVFLSIFLVFFSSCEKEDVIATGTFIGNHLGNSEKMYVSMLIEVDKEYPIGNYFESPSYGIYQNIIHTQPLYLSDTTMKVNQKIVFSYRKYNPDKDYHLFPSVVTYPIYVPLNTPKYVIINYQILK